MNTIEQYICVCVCVKPPFCLKTSQPLRIAQLIVEQASSKDRGDLDCVVLATRVILPFSYETSFRVHETNYSDK